MSEVTAVVIGARSDSAAALNGTQVHDVLVAPGLLDIRETAGAAATSLLWLIDSGAAPSGHTLPPLLERAPGPAASLPVNRLGDTIEPLMGRFTESDVEGLLQAAGRHCVPLRHIRVTSLLIARDLVLGLAPPDPGRFGCYAGAEWTARAFRRSPGVLVPRSRIRVDEYPVGSPLQALRVARTGAWRRGETLRELYRTLAGRVS